MLNTSEKKTKWFLNPSTTQYNSDFLARLSDMISLDKLEFHIEQGHMIADYDVRVKKSMLRTAFNY